jgi:peptidoglycan hydrolase-like protein with peptidoglycan-binding domain
MHRPRRAGILLAVFVVGLASACAQVRRVGDGRSDEERQEAREEKKPAAGSEEKKPATSGEAPRDKGQPAQKGRPPLPATPSSLVTASAARQLKEELQSRGFLTKPSPGPDLDAATSDAVRRFQQKEGLAATGFPDQETLRRLNIDAAEAYESAPEETNP